MFYFQNDRLRLNIPVIPKVKIKKQKLRDFLGNHMAISDRDKFLVSNAKNFLSYHTFFTLAQ